MPNINLNGLPPGQKPPGGTYTGSVSDNPNRSVDFAHARASTQRAEAQHTQAERDYDKAIGQRASQLNAEAAATARRSRQEDGLWRQREAAEQKRQRELDQATAKEIRARESALRQQQQAAHKREMDLLNKGRQEWALRRIQGHMEHRASFDVSPAGWRTMQRQGAVFNERVGAFERRWGHAPRASVANVMAGLGTEQNAYAVGSISRLGIAGQAAGANRSWRELGKIEHELRRIERVVAEQLKFAKSPSEKANVQRQEDAILHARERIAAGRDVGGGGARGTGSSAFGRMRAAFGESLGGGKLGMFLKLGEAAGVAAAGITAAASEPFMAAGAVRKLAGAEEPYIRFKLGAAQLARAGGFSGSAIERRFLPTGEFAAATGGLARPAWMRAIGLGPEDALANFAAFGAAPLNGKQAQSIAGGIRRNFLRPGLGMSEQQVGQLAGIGSTLGIIGGSGIRSGTNYDEALNKYFAKFAQVSATATAIGLDRSRVGATIASALTAQSHLAPASLGSIGNDWARMVASGDPSMRTGSGLQSAITNTQNAALGLGVGGDVGRNIVMSEFIQRHGGIQTTEEGLRKQLGYSRKQWSALMSTPAKQQALRAYFSTAGHNNPLAYNYLGQIIGSDSLHEMNHVFSGSGFDNKNIPLGIRLFARARFTGATLGQTLDYTSNGEKLAGMGNAPVGTAAQESFIRQQEKANGIPKGWGLSLIAAESGTFGGSNPAQVTGHGPLSWKGSVSTGMSMYASAIKSFAKDGLSGDQLREAATAQYNLGPGRHAQILQAVRSGNLHSLPSNLSTAETAFGDVTRQNRYLAQYQDRGTTTEALNVRAREQEAKIGAARYVYDHDPSDRLVSFANNVSHAGDAAETLAHRLEDAAVRIGKAVEGMMPWHHAAAATPHADSAHGHFTSHGHFMPPDPRK